MSKKDSKPSGLFHHRTPPQDSLQFAWSTDNDEHDCYSDEDTNSEYDLGLWNPGDGVCPSASEFNAVNEASYEAWCAAARGQPHCGSYHPLLLMEAFLDLLQDVPNFFHDPPKTVDILGRPENGLMLRSSVQVTTSDDPTCQQPSKSMLHVQFLALPAPMKYKVKSQTPMPLNVHEGLVRDRSGLLTTITLAWSYILSCRWVEILQHAGQNSSLWHCRGEQMSQNFWELVRRNRWIAQVKRAKVTHYPPWMLRQQNDKLENR